MVFQGLQFVVWNSKGCGGFGIRPLFSSSAVSTTSPLGLWLSALELVFSPSLAQISLERQSQASTQTEYRAESSVT